MQTLIRRAVLLIFASLLLTIAQSSHAASEAKRIAIHVEGSKAAHYRELLLKSVPEGLEVVDEATFRQALAKVGLRGPLGYGVSSARGRGKLLKVIRKAAKKAKIDLILIGRATPARGGTQLLLLAIDQSDTLKVDDKLKLKGDDEAQSSVLAAAVEPVLAPLAPSPEEEAQDADALSSAAAMDDLNDKDDEEEEDDGEGYQAHRPGYELLSAGLAFELGGRFFSYSASDPNVNSPQLRPYDLFGTAGIHVSAEIYPAATTDIDYLKDVGVSLSLMRAAVPSSSTSDGLFSFSTSYNRFAAGLRYRVRLGDEAEPIVVGGGLGFGLVNFTFETEKKPAAAPDITNEVASAEYAFIRLNADGRIPIAGMLAVMPSFGFAIPFGYEDGPLPGGDGQVYERFRDTSVLGLDFGLAAAIPVAFGIEARVGIEYARFFSSFSPEPGDAYVAGGALDQFLALRLGAGYIF